MGQMQGNMDEPAMPSKAFNHCWQDTYLVHLLLQGFQTVCTMYCYSQVVMKDCIWLGAFQGSKICQTNNHTEFAMLGTQSNKPTSVKTCIYSVQPGTND